MKMMMTGALLSLALAAPFGSTPSMAAQPFTVTSTTFKEGGMLPVRVGGNLASNPNCHGQALSPELSWQNAPASTKSFVVVMVDPESQNGLGTVHWVAYGIPSNVTNLPEGAGSKVNDLYIAGRGTHEMNTFDGPCTAPPATHHYVFTVIATDLDPKALPPDLTRDEVFARLNGHAKLAAGIAGLFNQN